MGTNDGDRFKMIRRNSVRNEVDGSFEEIEEFEDRNEDGQEPSPRNTNWATHQECVLLNRVLSDKTKLPSACFAPPTAPAVRRGTTRRDAPTSPPPQDETAIRGLVRRITGAVQPVLGSLNPPHVPKKELGGVVTKEECQSLADYLSPSVGGQYLLPTACSGLLDKGGDHKKSDAEVNARLKRRTSIVAKEVVPPTMC